MKSNSIRILFSILCMGLINAALLGMDMGLVGHLEAISNRNNRRSEQEEMNLIYLRINSLYDALNQQHSKHMNNFRKAKRLGSGSKNNTDEKGKAEAIRMDRQHVWYARKTFDTCVAQGMTVENATHNIQIFIEDELDTERPAIQILHDIFSTSSLSDNSR